MIVGMPQRPQLSRRRRPGRPKGTPRRLLFGGLLLVAVTLTLDYREFAAHVARLSISPDRSRMSLVPLVPVPPGETWPQWPAHNDPLHRNPMKFDLMPTGRLLAAGTITTGTAEAFAAELAKRGSYVKTIVLNSPGGSVRDALQMGRLIRKHGYATEVGAGGTCVSSCPLLLAGGVERRVAETAKIGVHQITPVPQPGVSPAGAVDATQRVLAECEHYLRAMNVDLAVWTYAKQTPRDQLHYFKPEELLSLRLATRPRRTEPGKKDRPRS